MILQDVVGASWPATVLAAGADLYAHEMPGGQYTNLFQQAHALGLAERWPQVCRMYADVNQLFGDIVKVTPTSKAVGDMALFLVANDLSCEELMATDRELAFPQSVLDLISGRMGQVVGGFEFYFAAKAGIRMELAAYYMKMKQEDWTSSAPPADLPIFNFQSQVWSVRYASGIFFLF